MGGRVLSIISLSVPESFVVSASTARPGSTMNKANIRYCRRFALGLYFIFLCPFQVGFIKDKHGLHKGQWWLLHHLTLPDIDGFEEQFLATFPSALLDTGPLKFSGTVVEDSASNNILNVLYKIPNNNAIALSMVLNFCQYFWRGFGKPSYFPCYNWIRKLLILAIL